MEAPGLRRRLEDVFQGTEVLFDETEKPPAVPPPTPGAAVQTSDTSACSDRKGSLSVRVSMCSRGVLLRAEPLQYGHRDAHRGFSAPSRLTVARSCSCR